VKVNNQTEAQGSGFGLERWGNEILYVPALAPEHTHWSLPRRDSQWQIGNCLPADEYIGPTLRRRMVFSQANLLASWGIWLY